LENKGNTNVFREKRNPTGKGKTLVAAPKTVLLGCSRAGRWRTKTKSHNGKEGDLEPLWPEKDPLSAGQQTHAGLGGEKVDHKRHDLPTIFKGKNIVGKSVVISKTTWGVAMPPGASAPSGTLQKGSTKDSTQSKISGKGKNDGRKGNPPQASRKIRVTCSGTWKSGWEATLLSHPRGRGEKKRGKLGRRRPGKCSGETALRSGGTSKEKKKPGETKEVQGGALYHVPRLPKQPPKKWLPKGSGQEGGGLLPRKNRPRVGNCR